MSEDKKLKALLDALVKKSAEDGKGRFEELLYAQKLLGKMPQVRVVKDEWYAYDGTAWMESSRHEYLPLALSTCPKRYRKARHAGNLLDHVEAQAQVRPETLIGFHKFFEEKDGDRSVLINALNGVVKVWPGGEITLEKHDPAYGFTAHVESTFDEAALCPIFLETLAAALPDVADHELIQSFCGNVLWPSAEFETALISYGRGGTGKSTLAEAIAYVLADPDGPAPSNIWTSLSMVELCNSRSYSLHKLRYAGLNLVTEIDTIEMDESTNFKQIVSGETIEVRPIYGKPRPMRTSCKLWAVTNTLPRFKTGTDAELRRLRIVHFDVLPAKKDTSMKMRLRAERDGIFQWMLAGLMRLQRDRAIPMGGEKSRLIIDKFAISNDPVGWFIKHRCTLDRGTKVMKETMKEAFIAFLEDHGLPEQFEGYFFRRMYERFPEVTPLRQRSHTGAKVQYVSGISLNPEPDLLA